MTSDEVALELVVSKARGDAALSVPVPLVVTGEVRVDTSHDIP